MAGLFDHFEKYDVQATRAEARAEAREDGIKNLIETLKELGTDKEKAYQQLKKRYELTEEETYEKMNLYWK